MELNIVVYNVTIRQQCREGRFIYPCFIFLGLQVVFLPVTSIPMYDESNLSSLLNDPPNSNTFGRPILYTRTLNSWPIFLFFAHGRIIIVLQYNLSDLNDLPPDLLYF